MADQKTSNPQLEMPYRLRETFLSTPEIVLFRMLQKMVGERYVICPKVALTDVFSIVRPNENVHFYNKIFRKHVDFLLCDPQTMKPVLGVELVMPMNKAETRASDQFMEDLFLSEGIPLVHVPLNDHYEQADLIHLFQLALTKSKEMIRPIQSAERDSVPLCPVCGKMTVLRIRREGPNAGQQYYGCIDNPHCPGTVKI